MKSWCTRLAMDRKRVPDIHAQAQEEGNRERLALRFGHNAIVLEPLGVHQMSAMVWQHRVAATGQSLVFHPNVRSRIAYH